MALQPRHLGAATPGRDTNRREEGNRDSEVFSDPRSGIVRTDPGLSRRGVGARGLAPPGPRGMGFIDRQVDAATGLVDLERREGSDHELGLLPRDRLVLQGDPIESSVGTAEEHPAGVGAEAAESDGLHRAGADADRFQGL